MKPAREVTCRCVIKNLLTFAVIVLSQIVLPVTLFGQAPRPLQLTAEVIEQRYCSIKPDKITLQLKLRVRYSNLGAERLIIYQGHDLFYQIKVRSDVASGAWPYEVLLLNMHYFDEEFERIDASSPGKVFEKLAPGKVFERELITGLGVTDHDKERSSTTVKPGWHTVHVIVSTWYQTPQLAVKLKEQWQRKGVLWTQPLTSVPVSLVIEKPAAALPCR
ncbi:MAG TPA: hypothetical protein VJV21_08110 [Pyrinomonadaceae bacterium]|nr:hypothetical protein [Pyrinomonadaceae bacterium]